MRLIAIVILVFLCSFVRAQKKPDVLLGVPYKPNSKIQFQGVFGENDTSIFGVNSEFGLRALKSIYLSTYDKETLELIDQVDITPVNSDSLSFEPTEIVSLKGRVFLFSTAQHRGSKQRFAVVHPINSDYQREQPFILLDTLSGDHASQFDFSIVIDSAESGFVLVNKMPFESFVNQKIEFKSFSSDLKLRWNALVELPYKELNFSFDQIYFDGTNRIVFLGKQKVGVPVELSNHVLDNNKYHLFVYDFNDKRIEEAEIKLQERWIRSVQMQVDSDRIVLAGYYERGNELQKDGVFSIGFNFKLDLLFAELSPVRSSDDEHNTQVSNGYNLQNMVSRKLIRLHDNYLLVGEEHFKEISPRYDMRTDITSYNDVFHFYNIRVSVIDSAGNVVNTVVIPKFQLTNNDGGVYSSIFVGQDNVGQHIFVVYNDTDRNQHVPLGDIENHKPMNSYRKNVGVCVAIDYEGNSEKHILYGSEQRMNFMPIMAGQLSDGSIIMLGERLKQHRLIRVRL